MTNWWEFHRGPRIFEWTAQAIGLHSGIDLQAPCGTDIQSPVEGTVLNAHTMPWGGQIDVATEDVPNLGPVILTFLHTSAEYVQPGDKVTPGISLGASGQPPPGAGYGGGCHIHFEVTHGTVAPYDSGKYSPSKNPDVHSYPMDPGQVLDWIATHKPPDPIGGYKSPPTPPVGPILPPGGISIPGVGSLGDFLGAVAGWLLNPARVLKLLMGIMLMFIGLIIAFLPDFGAAAATAAGAPELAPAAAAAGGGHPGKAFGSLIRAGGRNIGKERAATKEHVTQQRATARARTLEETRLTREAATKPLRNEQVVQLNALRAERGQAARSAAQTAPLTVAPPASRPRPAVQRAPKQGPLVMPTGAPAAKPARRPPGFIPQVNVPPVPKPQTPVKVGTQATPAQPTTKGAVLPNVTKKPPQLTTPARARARQAANPPRTGQALMGTPPPKSGVARTKISDREARKTAQYMRDQQDIANNVATPAQLKRARKAADKQVAGGKTTPDMTALAARIKSNRRGVLRRIFRRIGK